MGYLYTVGLNKLWVPLSDTHTTQQQQLVNKYKMFKFV